MRRPRLLDLFCGAGGASAGYHSTGFDVWGVDKTFHKAYPYTQTVADARDVLADSAFLALFDVIHASPPCQENSITKNLRNAQGGTVKPDGGDLIGPVREALDRWGGTYVIENVPRSPMRCDLELCGTAFDLHVMRGSARRPLWRHRWFESNAPLGLSPPCDHGGLRPLGVYGTPSDDIPGGGQTCLSVKEAAALMRIGWMTRWDDIKEAIPPAYTHFIGHRILEQWHELRRPA